VNKPFQVASECLGLCPDGLSTYLRVGGPVEGQGAFYAFFLLSLVSYL
jgi:hypothetical protein